MPVRFNPFHCIDDLQYLGGGMAPQVAQQADERNANDNFIQSIVLVTSSNLKGQDIMCIDT